MFQAQSPGLPRFEDLYPDIFVRYSGSVFNPTNSVNRLIASAGSLPAMDYCPVRLREVKDSHLLNTVDKRRPMRHRAGKGLA